MSTLNPHGFFRISHPKISYKFLQKTTGSGIFQRLWRDGTCAFEARLQRTSLGWSLCGVRLQWWGAPLCMGEAVASKVQFRDILRIMNHFDSISTGILLVKVLKIYSVKKSVKKIFCWVWSENSDPLTKCSVWSSFLSLITALLRVDSDQKAV